MKRLTITLLSIAIAHSAHCETKIVKRPSELSNLNQTHVSINDRENIKAKIKALGTRRAVTFQGVPVYGESRLETQSQKQLSTALSIHSKTANRFNPRPTLSTKEAINRLIQQVKPVANIESSEATLFVKLIDNKPRLVYLVSYFTDSSHPSKPTGFVDAHTGEIIEYWQGLNALNATGPGGNQKIGLYDFGDDFPYLKVAKGCVLSTNNVVVYDGSTDDRDKIFYFEECKGRNPSNTYKQTNGAFSPLNDAFFFGEYIVNQFKNNFGITPTKHRLRINVHYTGGSTWYNNAIYLGDGNETHYPFASMDAIAHEVGHGFTEKYSTLENRNQSGAIADSFSDMTSVYMKTLLNKPTIYPKWLFGEALVKGPRGEAIRYFDDPTRDGVSIANAADYTPGMNLHHASGVFNRALYLLAKKHGWNSKKAYESFLLANQIFFKPNTTFDEAACDIKRAGRELGYRERAVEQVFARVGVDASCQDRENGDDLALVNNTAVNDLAGHEESMQYFYIDVPEGQQSLLVNLTTGIGEADLYLRHDKHPTLINYDCRPYNDGDKLCAIPSPQPGRYYIMVYGYGGFSHVSLNAHYA